jgi:Na+-transporting NADH:ubiquinone oxidoreductase subunit C
MADKFGPGYTIAFAGAVAMVCSVFVALSVVLLRPRQEENRRLDRMRNVLAAAALLDQSDPPPSVEELFNARVRPIVVTLATGQESSAVPALEYDQRRAAQDPSSSAPPDPDPARVRRVPALGAVYLVLAESSYVSALVLPVHGAGLWGQMYGYLALDIDGRTILGVSFYEHQETPGLGAEIENERYVRRWIGRQVTDGEGTIRFEVTKDNVGPPEEDPHRVDAITGATQTSNGLTELVRFWLGPQGYGPFLERFRRQHQAGRQAS